VKLTLEQYYALPKYERTILRRAAFGATLPVGHTDGYDLAHIKAILIAENEATGEFPERWVDQSEEEELADFLRK
jgi:hypothetical protein